MYQNKTPEEVYVEFNVSPETGLTQEEAQLRLEKFGKNKLVGKPKKSILNLFLSQMKDALIYVLLVAAVITFFIGEYVDTIIIISVVLINAAIGVFQESKAEKAIEALQKMSTPRALVKRDGKVVEINSEDLVPGDLVVLDAGRYILADLRIVESANLQIDEATLTGESIAVSKKADLLIEKENTPLGDRLNMAFMSTLVTYGRGMGVAIATGMSTEIGKIATILDEDDDSLTPLQKRLDELGKTLGFLALGISILIILIGFIQERPIFDMFLTAISLAVAAIPEGLAAIVAIVLALGVTRMSKINAIVKKLPAVETLGSVNIVCSDKTGTLTQNKMTVVKSYTEGTLVNWPSKAEDSSVLPSHKLMAEALMLCSDATYDESGGTGDPTEIALIAHGLNFDIVQSTLNNTYPRILERPFDSERKRMSVLVSDDTAYRVITKGAIDNLLPLCTHVMTDTGIVLMDDTHKTAILDQANKLSDEALRILGVAFKTTIEELPESELENSLTFMGFVGMIDPPRLEVKAAIEKAKMAGIRPIMITGDHKNTALAIAKELGMAEGKEQSITGAEIDLLSDDEFIRNINNYRVFARVSPEHKVKIVKAFKSHGHVVSMTGDGVNDAPSLKFADIGVAMGITGTDVSKSASDIILTDDNFTTIIHAIEEGRNIYNNIKKSVIFLLSCNLGEVVAIFASIMFGWPVPLLPTQILWINLITDSLPAIALGIDPGDKGIMKQQPRDPKESFFSEGAGIRAIMGGLLIGTLTLIGFYIGLAEFGYKLGSRNIPTEVLNYARTIAFVVLAASQLIYSVSIRHRSKSLFQIGIFTNLPLLGAIATGLLLQLAVISIPFTAAAFKVQMLSSRDWGIVITLALIPLILNEILKLFIRLKDSQI